MPVYEYQCPACGERVLHVRRVAERDVELQCLNPDHEPRTLERVVTTPGYVQIEGLGVHKPGVHVRNPTGRVLK